MQKKKAVKNRSSKVLSLAVLAVLIALVVVLTGRMNELEAVNVVRVGASGSEKYLSDEDIIRASGLKLGASVNAVDDMTELVERNINELGFVSFVSVERESKNAVRLTVQVRMPVLAVSVGENCAVIDRDGYVVKLMPSIEGLNVLKVDGMALNFPEVGKPASTTPASQLREILDIAYVVVDNGYADIISNLSIYDGTYRFITQAGLLARFYPGDDMDETLRIVKGFVAKGFKTGEVIISGGQASYLPREQKDGE